MIISAFDMFSIGIGPSSSHTVGPMRAAKKFTDDLTNNNLLDSVTAVKVELFGSLGQTGIGHGTGKAVILGLAGYLPETVDPDAVPGLLKQVSDEQQIRLAKVKPVSFPREGAIVFHRRKTLKEHSNGMELIAYDKEKNIVLRDVYFSIGGGFIVKAEDFAKEKEAASQFATDNPPPYPFESGAELLALCKEHGLSIAGLMLENEKVLRSPAQITDELNNIWLTMRACIERGIKTEGILPGGLKVKRRAPALYKKLMAEKSNDPLQVMDWVNLFALAVNEENAAGGRVVTAPTNGAAGIIPAVLMYYDKFIQPVTPDIAVQYLLTAAAIGILYKKNASISGAEVGCQGEVGVACSMAAAALT
jgi:L-serine dehydratase